MVVVCSGHVYDTIITTATVTATTKSNFRREYCRGGFTMKFPGSPGSPESPLYGQKKARYTRSLVPPMASILVKGKETIPRMPITSILVKGKKTIPRKPILVKGKETIPRKSSLSTGTPASRPSSEPSGIRSPKLS